jgi:hypothetical protein
VDKKRVPGFTYILSSELKQEVALSHKTGWVYCEDKGPDGKPVAYSPAELAILEKTGTIITPAIHNIKKVIGGTIVEYGNGTGSNIKGKPNAEPITDRGHDLQNPGGKIPGPGGNVPAERSGELEIF